MSVTITERTAIVIYLRAIADDPDADIDLDVIADRIERGEHVVCIERGDYGDLDDVVVEREEPGR